MEQEEESEYMMVEHVMDIANKHQEIKKKIIMHDEIWLKQNL